MFATHKPDLLSQVPDRGAYTELRQLLPSQAQVISSAIDQPLDFIAKLRKADGSEIDIEVALGEALENAVIHGNRDSVDSKQSSGISTIRESPVRNMPNLDERFSNLLPLVPGVVRGPNGQINMKGARASENGSLLNSADVTDPATDTSTFNIPIDVFSSAQVLSTPYDPEDGKFTGAVSNVETLCERFPFSAPSAKPSASVSNLIYILYLKSDCMYRRGL